MSKFVLLLALLSAAGELQPYRTLTPQISLRECESLKENRVLQVSYLEDFFGEKMPGTAVLACVEYSPGKSHAAK